MIVLETLATENWPLAQAFRISRGTKTHATTVSVIVRCAQHAVTGRGECVPYARYGETTANVRTQIETMFPLDAPDCAQARLALDARMSPGAARNAIDCALWDLEARLTGTPVWQLAGLVPPLPALTCYTLSLDTPARMAAEAAGVPHLPLLKLKLGSTGDRDRMEAVRASRPDARLVVDANEGWQPDDVPDLLTVSAALGIELVEQPLAAAADQRLAGITSPVPLCADESAAPGADLTALSSRYQAVNIKLDKTGGLTNALAAVRTAKRHGLGIMIGSMVATSLGMAPALLLAADANWIDLDSPLLLARDRPHGLRIDNGVIAIASPQLWGG